MITFLNNKIIKGHMFVLAAIVCLVMVFIWGHLPNVKAANPTWVQTDWSSGASASTAVHPTNQTNWANYTTSSSGVATSTTPGQLTLTSTSTSWTDADFSGATLSQTATSSGDVILSTISTEWSAGHINTADGTGFYASVDAVDSDTIFVSCYNATDDTVELASSTDGGSTWTLRAVASVGSGAQPTSINAVDANNIFISYINSSGYNLEFASSTDGGGAWSTRIIDSASAFTSSVSMDAVDSNTIFISYYDSTGDNLKFASSTDGGGTWSTRTIDSGGDTGQHTSVKAVDADTIFISYYDNTNQNLVFAKSTNGGGTWSTTTVDGGGDVGEWSSLYAVDANTLFISYLDDSGDDLEFASSTDGGATWSTSTIDSVGVVGKYASISAADANTIFVSYFNDSANTLKVASSTDGGQTWMAATVDSGSTGYYTSINVVDSSHIFVGYHDYSALDLEFAKRVPTYNTQGTTTSAIKDTDGTLTWGNISWTATTPANTDIMMRVRTDSNNDMSGATNWNSCGFINSETDITSHSCVTDTHRYIQYQAIASTSDNSITPTLSDVTINYQAPYSATSTLTSSFYDSSNSADVLSSIGWTESLAELTDIKFQIRTADDSGGSPNTWTNWCGPDDEDSSALTCATNTYFTDAAGGETMDDMFTDSSGDQWIQYRTFLTTNGTTTPTLSDVTLTYILNTAPTSTAASISGADDPVYAGVEYAITAIYTDVDGYADLTKCFLKIDHDTDTDIEMYLTETAGSATGTVTVLTGEDYLIGAPTYSYSTTTQELTAVFTFTLDWDWTESTTTEYSVSAADSQYATSTYSATDIDVVYENDLTFSGATAASGSVQGALSSGDWVQGEETITWSGLTVVYQGSAVNPADDDFNIRITDDDTGSWTQRTGNALATTTEADTASDSSDVHNIDIINIPTGGSDVSSETFTIKVDADAPSGADLTYSSITASSITATPSGATDGSGSGLAASPYYIEVDKNTTIFSSADANSGWTGAAYNISSLSANLPYSFRVKAKDAVGNISTWTTPSPAYKYTAPEGPSGLTVASTDKNEATLSADSFSNDSTGSSAYYFYLAGDEANHSSGWISSNSWQDTGLTCGANYTWYVKHRNADSLETSSTSATGRTKSCGGQDVFSSDGSGNVIKSLKATIRKNVGSNAWVQVEIEPNTFHKSTMVDAIPADKQTVLSEKALPQSLKMLGNLAIEIKTTDNEEKTFQRPVKVVFKYNENQLINSGIDEESLMIYKWNETEKKWLRLKSTIDKVSKTITTYDSSFSWFLVAGLPEQTADKQAIVIQLQNQINDILQKINILKKQLAEMDSNQPTSEQSAIGRLTDDLRFGQRNEQVILLQTWLAQDPLIYPKGIISGWFGPLTREAVIRFQEKYAEDVLKIWGLNAGTGLVGKTTRAKLNELFGSN